MSAAARRSRLLAATLALSSALASATLGCAADASEEATRGVVEVDLGGDRTLERGKPRAVSATVRYDDGTTEVATSADGLDVAVDDPDVARVERDGDLRGLTIGVTTLRATFGGRSAVQRLVVAR